MSGKLNIDVTKRLGGFTISVRQSLPLEGITAIFGPSGAGKSSLLKLIAGFENLDAGRISLKDNVWVDRVNKINIPPYKRNIGYMFQDGRLFPHMTARQNLEFAAKRATKKILIKKIIKAFDLEKLLNHMPQTLSGGERRRVALARTVLIAPDILLLDEPLTGLDRSRKRNILPFIESLSRDFSIPCLYVTHDIEEVGRLAKKVMVMSEGRVTAFGETIDILNHLDSTPLFADYEVSSLFEGRITEYDEALQMMTATLDGAVIHLPVIPHVKIGDTLRLRIRAADVAIALKQPVETSVRNVIAAEVSDIIEDLTSAYAIITLMLAGHTLRARITRASLRDLDLRIGMTVFALIKSVSFDGRL